MVTAEAASVVEDGAKIAVSGAANKEASWYWCE